MKSIYICLILATLAACASNKLRKPHKDTVTAEDIAKEQRHQERRQKISDTLKSLRESQPKETECNSEPTGGGAYRTTCH